MSDGDLAPRTARGEPNDPQAGAASGTPPLQPPIRTALAVR